MFLIPSQSESKSPSLDKSSPPTRKAPLLKSLERWAGYSLIICFQSLVKHAGPRGTAYWGKVIGFLFYKFSSRYRKIALKNLQMVYPEATMKENLRITRSVFANFGMSATEFLRLPSMPEHEFTDRITMEGKEYLDAALALGKGVLMVTAHFGNWELMSARLMREGYLLDAIARDPELAATSRLLREIRESRTLYNVYPKTSLLPVTRALKQNRIVGVVADQHDFNGIVIDFLGHPARTPVGPAALALLTGAQLMSAFCYRKADYSFHIRLYPNFSPEATGDKAADIERIIKRLTATTEEVIREFPEQWLWFHDRWRPYALPRKKSILRQIN